MLLLQWHKGREGLLHQRGFFEMQSKSIEIYTYAASHKTKLLTALNTTSSASLMAGFKASDNDIK
jgi:hypothetical protein